jgi:hypothetical protein
VANNQARSRKQNATQSNPRLAMIRASHDARRARKRGEPAEPEPGNNWARVELPVLADTSGPLPGHVPCRTCPKYRLMPVEYGGSPPPFGGLHPDNIEAVQLYRLCRRDSRVGFGGHLLDTMSITDAVNAVEAFALQLGSGLHKRNLIQKIMLIDGVATRVRRKMEETIRNSQENAGGGRRRSREV